MSDVASFLSQRINMINVEHLKSRFISMVIYEIVDAYRQEKGFD